MDGGNLESIHQAKPLYMHAEKEARSCVTLDVQILMVLMASQRQGRIKEFWCPRQQRFWDPYVHAGTDLRSLLIRYPIDIWTIISSKNVHG